MSKQGSHMLDKIRAKAFYSAPANYGAAFTTAWDNDGKCRTMGLTLEEIEKIMEERRLLYG
jgi:glutaconate CoA-transferase, subunit A